MSDSGSPESAEPESPWWAHGGLMVRDGRLTIAGRDAEGLARDLGTPRYVFDLVRVQEQAGAIQDALANAGIDHRLLFAMKSCREPEMLRFIRGLGGPMSPRGLGIDACSPREVALARASGWSAEEISLTGSNLTDDDLTETLSEPVHINVDLLSQMRRVGRLFPGREVGIRVNPRVSAVREGGELYSGDRPTKFGIYLKDLAETLDIARQYRLRITVVHFHIGWAYRTDELATFEQGIKELSQVIEGVRDAGHPVEAANVGGGLGVPYLPGEPPLDLRRWAEILERHLARLGVVVLVEPGEFLVKEAGVLLAEAVTVEERLGQSFVGLNVGWNAMQQRYVYDEPIVFAPCLSPKAEPNQRVTFAGNVNDADDLFAIGHRFPPVEEGDIVAMIAAGAYNQSMANEHCLRPRPVATYFVDRT